MCEAELLKEVQAETEREDFDPLRFLLNHLPPQFSAMDVSSIEVEEQKYEALSDMVMKRVYDKFMEKRESFGARPSPTPPSAPSSSTCAFSRWSTWCAASDGSEGAAVHPGAEL